MHRDQVFHVDLVLEDVLSRTILGILPAGLDVIPNHGHLILRGLHGPNGMRLDSIGGQKEGSEHG